jgi:hypothetical protein
MQGGRPPWALRRALAIDSFSPVRVYTVATGVAGEPTAPGRHSGGAVIRK